MIPGLQRRKKCPQGEQTKEVVLIISSIFHDYKGGSYFISTVRDIASHASIISDMNEQMKIHCIEPLLIRDELTS